MKLVQGRKRSIKADSAVTEELLEQTKRERAEYLRVWCPPRHVAFGRRDARVEGYSEARQAALSQGYQTSEREVGGHAVACTGSTVAVARTEYAGSPRTTIDDDYETMSAQLRSALQSLGVEAVDGEPNGSFCPGSHSIMVNGKIAGIAQRISSDAKLISAIIVVRDHEQIADVLAPIYDCLGVPFERDAVGSVEHVIGPIDPQTVIEELAGHMADGVDTVKQV